MERIPRRKHSDEFKLSSVELVTKQGCCAAKKRRPSWWGDVQAGVGDDGQERP
jgi:hypothetical protein